MARSVVLAKPKLQQRVALPVVKESRDWKDFGTELFPLRGSLLKRFLECPRRMLAMYDEPFITNDRIETGSAVHKLIETLEREGKVTDKDKKKVFQDYPKAKETESLEYFNGYVRRREEITEKYGPIAANEEQLFLRLPSAKGDPTQKEIVIGCTIDQLRKKAKTFTVVDFKVSSLAITDMVKIYALQISAYMLCVEQNHNTKDIQCSIVNPILAARPRSVYQVKIKFTLDKCRQMLAAIQEQVKLIREGNPMRLAGSACRECKLRSPEFC